MIKEFIEKSIEGGYMSAVCTYKRVRINDKTKMCTVFYKDEEWDGTTKWHVSKPTSEILLDPKAWEAVGKVEGWEQHNCHHDEETGQYVSCSNECYPLYRDKMHQFLDNLIEGQSIEGALNNVMK